MCLEAADQLAKETGTELEVIDLRSLSPLDKDTILASVKKTGKALVVHEDKVFGGFGGEVAALITEEAFEYLDGPVKRVGSTFTPVGFNRILEKAILPNTEKIRNAMKELLDY
jgi:2-oxoisovalerate dehydrogenase E1 component